MFLSFCSWASLSLFIVSNSLHLLLYFQNFIRYSFPKLPLQFNTAWPLHIFCQHLSQMLFFILHLILWSYSSISSVKSSNNSNPLHLVGEAEIPQQIYKSLAEGYVEAERLQLVRENQCSRQRGRNQHELLIALRMCAIALSGFDDKCHISCQRFIHAWINNPWRPYCLKS